MSKDISKALKKKTDAQLRLLEQDAAPIVRESNTGENFIADPNEYSQQLLAGKNITITTAGNTKTINAVMGLLAGDNITISAPDEDGKVTITGTVSDGSINGKDVSIADYTGKDGYVLSYDETNDQFVLTEAASGGGSEYTLPQATESALGGIKAKEKTTESAEVAIDTSTGKLFAPSAGQAQNGMPSGGTTGQILAKIDNTDYNAIWIDPPSGGGVEPVGDGTVDIYSLTDEQSGGMYTGVNSNMVIKGQWWLQSIIFKPVNNIVNGTINLRSYSGAIIQTIFNVNMLGGVVETVNLNEPILLIDGMMLRVEILFNGSMKYNRKLATSYDGILWKGEGLNVNSWTGTKYTEQIYIGLAEYLG